MAVTVTYDFQLLKTFEFPTGPSVGNIDLVGLANGGFAAVAEADDGNSSIEIFNGALAPTGARGPFANSNPAVIQLSSGNLAVVSTSTQGRGVLDILDQNAQFIGDRDFFTPDGEARSVDAAALTSGNFVVVTSYSRSIDEGQIVNAFIFNGAGTQLLSIPVTEEFISSVNPVVAALDDGGFVVAWESISFDSSVSLSFEIYNANGTLRRAETTIDSSSTGGMGRMAITATDGGFAVVYEDDTVSANTDIALRRFEADGDFIEYGTLSGPATIDQTPSIARMPDGLLAVGFGYSYVSTADSETFAGLYNPFTRTFLAQRIGLMGNPVTDDTDEPVVAGFGAGRLAYFHRDTTDNDVDGEALEVVRTSTGDAGGDLFDSSSYRDIQNGGGGSDFLDGGGNDDTLNGGSGGDNLFGGPGNDILTGGTEIDTAFYTGTAAVTVNLSLTAAQNTGGAGIDTLSGIENLIGGNGNDILTGNAGKNALSGAAGNDRMTGGLDDDAYSVGESGDVVVEAASQGYDTVNATLLAYTLPANVEQVNYSGFGNFTGAGNALANRMTGDAGNDRFLADAGGGDTFFGNGGSDTMDFRLSATGAVVNLGTGAHGGAAAGDVFNSIEIFYGSNTAADTFTGAALADRFEGFGGNDALFSGGGTDTVYGGLGNDRIDGGTGSDTALNGDAGNDTIAAGDGDDIANGGDNDDKIYGQAGRDTLRGGLGVDTLYGGDEVGAGDILLAGDSGNDHVQGGLGNDRIDGGTENDKLYGEGGNDTVTGGLGNDRLEGGADTDVLRGEDGDDYMLGGDGSDTLYGGIGLDRLYGNAGDDFLQGDGGNDNFYGGAGLDRFNFDAPNGSDVIFDLTNDQDTLIIDPAFGYFDAAQVLANTIQSGNHVRILLPGSNTDIYLWDYLAPGSGNTIGNLSNDILIA